MFDLHYDLLTNILMRQNDVRELKKYCKEIYNEDNIVGGIFNLFYMSPKEMKEELNINYEDIDIIKNLRTVNSIIKKNRLIPQGIEYAYGIEGLDYLKKIDDIDSIYELGVRSVNIVWNNQNKFGAGIMGNKEQGLTKLGEELVEKLVSKNIAIDLSHANEKTFDGIITMCKKMKERKPKIFASHSNAKKICDVGRNLSDKQLLKIKEFEGIIGVVSIKPFCINNKLGAEQSEYEQAYVENIKHIERILGGIDNIALSSDNMGYYRIQQSYYKNINIFNQKRIKEEIYNLIKKYYKKTTIEKIMLENMKKMSIIEN